MRLGASEAGKRNAHVKHERALRTWTKWQRAGNLSEKQNLPKPVNQTCEWHICRTLFCRLTPELSRPVAGRRTRASVAKMHAADATTRGRLERIVRHQRPAAAHQLQRPTVYGPIEQTDAQYRHWSAQQESLGTME